MVEGHTDSDPIRHSGWKSNWELGAARSLTVLHYLADKAGVDPAMMSAATFSKYQPVAGNDNAQGKAQNRRAVIVIYNNWGKPAAK
jgi:chemotaxis protein MotB